MDRPTDPWPPLHFADWEDTCDALHLWTQVIGKVRLAATPWLNHSWHVPFYVNARGLTTSAIYAQQRAFEIEFDFVDHRLRMTSSDGGREELALAPRSVADFHARAMSMLDRLGLAVTIDAMPALRRKGDRLTAYLEWLLRRRGAEVLTLEPRGSMLTVRFRSPGIAGELAKRGAVVDVRPPDLVRITPAPLYNSFLDVQRLGALIAGLPHA